MKAKKCVPLLEEVGAKIKVLGEKEAMQRLIEAGVSISLATKLVSDRYRVARLRDKTKDELQRFLTLVA